MMWLGFLALCTCRFYCCVHVYVSVKSSTNECHHRSLGLVSEDRHGSIVYQDIKIWLHCMTCSSIISFFHLMSTAFAQLWRSFYIHLTLYTLILTHNCHLIIHWPHIWKHFYVVYVHFCQLSTYTYARSHTLSLVCLYLLPMSFIHSLDMLQGPTQRAEAVPSPDIDMFWKWLVILFNQKSIGSIDGHVCAFNCMPPIMGRECTPLCSVNRTQWMAIMHRVVTLPSAHALVAASLCQ